MNLSTSKVQAPRVNGGAAPEERVLDSLLADPSMLLHLVEHSPGGIAVIDAERTYRQVNRAGCLLLGKSEAALLGRYSPWRAPASSNSAGSSGFEFATSIGRRQFSYTLTDIKIRGEQYWVVHFSDESHALHRERQLRTFAETSASIAFDGHLESRLDRLALEVRAATEMYSCTFLLYDEDGELYQSGTAGEYPRIRDYTLRLRECRELGAPLVSDDAIRQRRPLIVRGWRRATLADARFAPIHNFTKMARWDTIVVVPLMVRNRIAGVFNGFYLKGREPNESDLPFLMAIADQAAVTVDNSRLLAVAERQATLEERHRLARDLHDSVSQMLFSLSLQTRALELVVAQKQFPGEEQIHTSLREIRDLTHDALTEMRALIFQLRPADLHEEGLVPAIRKHAHALSSREDLIITVHQPTYDVSFDPAIETQLFRVAQEALHNVAKHVPGGHVQIKFAMMGLDGSDLMMEISDDGGGFDPEVALPGHYGLHTMSERIKAAGGELTVASDSAGTTIRAVLPGR